MLLYNGMSAVVCVLSAWDKLDNNVANSNAGWVERRRRVRKEIHYCWELKDGIITTCLRSHCTSDPVGGYSSLVTLLNTYCIGELLRQTVVWVWVWVSRWG